MEKKARFMEAVARKVGKRQPVMKRKPGMAVMIAIGAPKPGPMGQKPEDEMEDKGEEKVDMKTGLSKAEKIAALQEKIASLKAELALLEDEDEMEDESEMEKDESEYEDEDEED
jgi:hypothetical protein